MNKSAFKTVICDRLRFPPIAPIQRVASGTFCATADHTFKPIEVPVSPWQQTGQVCTTPMSPAYFGVVQSYTPESPVYDTAWRLHMSPEPAQMPPPLPPTPELMAPTPEYASRSKRAASVVFEGETPSLEKRMRTAYAENTVIDVSRSSSPFSV